MNARKKAELYIVGARVKRSHPSDRMFAPDYEEGVIARVDMFSSAYRYLVTFDHGAKVWMSRAELMTQYNPA